MSDLSEHHRRPPADKLRFFKSPVVSCGAQAKDRSSPSNKYGEVEDCRSDDLPEFERHEEPTLLEIFFDLFFAANYNVFSDTQQVTNHARFKSYTGYFCLLWLTWFLVTLFDVRYVTDSIFSRLTRAIQLGVLVGFAVVAPKFDPTDQHAETMRTMSLILMFSRACLAVEYGSTLWHVRRFNKARLAISLQIALHSIAAVIYLGVAFTFHKGQRSRAYMAWYFCSGVEAILTILLSNFSPVLSLTKTHLMKRMTLLTVMIMGEGIVQIAKEVVIIVKNPDAWNSVIIGLVSSATATIYFVFLVYFDWLKSSLYLPAWRQQAWTSIHLPFHLALVMFTQGFTQFLIWSKIVDVTRRVTLGFSDPANWLASIATSEQAKDKLKDATQLFFKDYPPKITSTRETVDAALANLTEIPDAFWPDLSTFLNTDNLTILTRTGEEAPAILVKTFDVLMSSMLNALFATFGIDLESDITTKNPAANSDVKGGDFQGHVEGKTWDRYNLVFAYTYIAAGCTLFFMVVLTIIARTTPLKAWPMIRLGIITLLALGTGLTATLFFYTEQVSKFLLSPWVLPTISLVWTVVLVLTHINGAYFKRHAHLFKRHAHLFKRRGPPYVPVSVPLTPAADWIGSKPQASDVHVDAQRRLPFSHPSDDAGKRWNHGAEEIGVAYGGLEKPQSTYDPPKSSTDHRDASQV